MKNAIVNVPKVAPVVKRYIDGQNVVTVMSRKLSAGVTITNIVKVPYRPKKADYVPAMQALAESGFPQKAISFFTNTCPSYVSKLLGSKF